MLDWGPPPYTVVPVQIGIGGTDHWNVLDGRNTLIASSPRQSIAGAIKQLVELHCVQSGARAEQDETNIEERLSLLERQVTGLRNLIHGVSPREVRMTRSGQSDSS